MSTTYRWYISASAVRDFMRIAGTAGDDDSEEFFAAERQLAALCDQARLRRERHDMLEFRVKATIRGYRVRLDLTVSPHRREEGPLAQLIEVRKA